MRLVSRAARRIPPRGQLADPLPGARSARPGGPGTALGWPRAGSAGRGPFIPGVSRLSAGVRRPGAVAAGEAEHGEAGEVDRGGEQGEAGGDLDQAADAGAAAAVTAAHQVGDLAFHLGPGSPVISFPGGVCLGLAGGGQPGLVRADADRAALPGSGALGGQRPAGSPGRPRRTGPSRRAARWQAGSAR
jgi:hypothetical protein